MNKKELLFLSALITGCQDEKLQTLEQLPIPRIEIKIPKTEEQKPSEKIEEKVQPRGIACTIDLSNRFIPELLSLSRDAPQYFNTEGILQNPLQRERFGIFSSFTHHQKPFEHYMKAMKSRGNEKQPKIENKFISYTTGKTVKKISSLKQQIKDNKLPEKEIKKAKKELETLSAYVQIIQNVQKILRWEGFYYVEIDGIYNDQTAAAVMEYQRFHQQYLRYNQKIEGKINFFTRQLLNKDFEEYAFGGVRRVLEERVFHAKCNGRYPYVIEQKELEKLVDSTLEQLGLNTLQGVQNFLSKPLDTATVYLEIPELYQQDSMKLEVEVEKWPKDRTKSKLRLFVVENEKRREIYQTKAVAGGDVKNKKTGRKREYKTPEGVFYMKNILLMPFWNPKKEVEEQEEVKEEEKLPGPYNAFGMILAPLYNNNKPQKKPFSSIQDGYEGYGIHLTAWPSSVEYGGASHGCIRIHPNMSRLFYFLARYTPHKVVLEEFEGRDTIKFIPLRGSSIPLEPEYYIKVNICEKKCEDANLQSHTP